MSTSSMRKYDLGYKINLQLPRNRLIGEGQETSPEVKVPIPSLSTGYLVKTLVPLSLGFGSSDLFCTLQRPLAMDSTQLLPVPHHLAAPIT